MTLLRNQHISWFNQNMDTLFSANVSGPFHRQFNNNYYKNWSCGSLHLGVIRKKYMFKTQYNRILQFGQM